MKRVVVLSFLAACTANEKPQARLVPLADCGEAKQFMKEVAIEKMSREIDRRLAEYEAGTTCRWYGDYNTDAAGAGSGSGDSSPPAPTTGTGTNNQVAGVDEADFIKNDGQYIYLAQNGALRIVDAWPADQTHAVSVTPLDGQPKKLFVLGDKALVYVATGEARTSWRNTECTYGYDCDFSGDGTATTLLVYNIADRAKPELERTISLSGSLIAARRIGSAVHTVVTQAASPFPEMSYDTGVELCGYSAWSTKPTPYYVMRARQAYENLRAANQKVIENTDLDQKLPSIADSAGLTDIESSGSCSSLYRSSITDGAAFTSIVSVDIDHPGPVKASTIVSRSGAIYASADALYMAVAHNWNGDTSTVHKFRISDIAGQTRYLASGYVPGRALNQFAMDERDGFLRIATTNGHVPSPDVESQLTVLAEDGKDLVEVGAVEHIAPSEDIRSVRFDGEKAFIVTFKKTDPLFAFDLSDPRAPKLIGELKIPGFSTYMHMMDGQHLLTIGYDADDHGSFAFFDGVLLQIFDVSDPTTPTLLHKYIIGTRGSSSEALTNHLAFTWYPEYKLLALPMTICEGGDDGTYGSLLTFSGLMVFDASLELGFAEHGRVPHAIGENVSCSNWWTNATSVVKRSLFLDNFVYSISDAELKVRTVDALSTELVTVPLQ